MDPTFPQNHGVTANAFNIPSKRTWRYYCLLPQTTYHVGYTYDRMTLFLQALLVCELRKVVSYEPDTSGSHYLSGSFPGQKETVSMGPQSLDVDLCHPGNLS